MPRCSVCLRDATHIVYWDRSTGRYRIRRIGKVTHCRWHATVHAVLNNALQETSYAPAP